MISGNLIHPSQIDFSGDFYRQLDEILKAIRLYRDDVLKLQLLNEDIQNVLSSRWPGAYLETLVSLVNKVQRKYEFIVNYRSIAFLELISIYDEN